MFIPAVCPTHQSGRICRHRKPFGLFTLGSTRHIFVRTASLVGKKGKLFFSSSTLTAGTLFTRPLARIPLVFFVFFLLSGTWAKRE